MIYQKNFIELTFDNNVYILMHMYVCKYVYSNQLIKTMLKSKLLIIILIK